MISKLCQLGGGWIINCDEATSDIQPRFHAHVSRFGLSYGTKEEYEFRFALFKKTDEEIIKINAESDSYTVAHNQFSTMTDDEKKKFFAKRPVFTN
jgi:hypothetical protein